MGSSGMLCSGENGTWLVGGGEKNAYVRRGDLRALGVGSLKKTLASRIWWLVGASRGERER